MNPVPLSSEIIQALLNHEGSKGRILRAAIAYERGDFADLGNLPPTRTPIPAKASPRLRARRPRRAATGTALAIPRKGTLPDAPFTVTGITRPAPPDAEESGEKSV